MKIIEREIGYKIKEFIDLGKAIVIMGPRQVGKTTLLNNIFSQRNDVLWLNGDDGDVQSNFDNENIQTFKNYLNNKKVLIVDEAQRIENIGLKLKILQDNLGNEYQIIATGSSSFDLSNKINEPMTGRKWELKMFPVTFKEMVKHTDLLTEKRMLNNRLLYGYYPDVINNPGKEKLILREIANDNLYKDIFKWENIKKPTALIKLLVALAHQVGSQVNISELSQLLSLDRKTVERYLTFLEQAFIIFRLGTYSQNLRNELKMSEKYYFYDVGIRNSLLGNFENINIRSDIGELFENFVIAELIKTNEDLSFLFPGYFWRTKDGQEVDYVEDKNGKIVAYEFKWNPKAKGKIPKLFLETYNPKIAKILNRDNFYEVLI
ncbi:MAG: ATP-binding protein [Candidatus Ancillula sp.]|jgi:predicted AAA+ superfamily ATPase|nr:ATP-binding protein [Candidatus Ancillula sp.]